MLVENPKIPMKKMYFRSPQRVNKDTSKSNSASAFMVFKELSSSDMSQELPLGSLKSSGMS